MIAKLIWDESDTSPIIPDEMMPKDRAKIINKQQLQGTHREKLCELAGRVCYDSLGSGRSSEEYHKHILEVNHLSTVEHAYFTVLVHFEKLSDQYHASHILMNRPGVFVEPVRPSEDNTDLRITVNFRNVLDFDKWSSVLPTDLYDNPLCEQIKLILFHASKQLAPIIFRNFNGDRPSLSWELTQPEHMMEKHVTLFMAGSRGFSHEMVRHRFNISQRSTRYCDESESIWVWHPLIETHNKIVSDKELPNELECLLHDTSHGCKEAYKKVVERLEGWLISRNIDKFNARKQARGAARGILGNALYTEMFFTAPVAMWRWMLDLRATLAADAEIRAIFCGALEALKSSQYGSHFGDYVLEPSPDGIGSIAVKKVS
jgi:thymidylate synthase ThyX